ncbi:hypothetical protein SLEP1_g13944 [Rubroshorea leprosula]|uniref:Uncharacterized protein n=1 Tax=Rubroshorea leprosula TaxID=152421 RepID=A0AAV5IHG9_9ROSI|nr:hypothetical protein SLEP1_g13944 [Rubroshorea leprosula]
MVHTRSVRAGNSSLSHGQGQPPNNLPPLIPPQIPPQFPPQVPTIFPPVDHAEGGDENQPHTSAHNSTSTANKDVVAAQLTAMQQQFGVFQLGQSHIAPTQQPIPDDVTRRLDSLEKLVAEHRGAPPPHHAVDSIPHPLNTNITLEPYPISFKIPQLETYDGTKDPDDHLHAFYSCMQAQNASDALMCKIFPSTLRAVDGELLYLYLGISDEAISSVLVREEAKQQKPIYYISSVLHGAELRYPIAEKAALAVVTSARKLRLYFQSHPIIVLTDQPLRQILQKPECSGRLIKWATLYVDGASSSKGSGAGALLLGPEGYRSKHALKFNFDATNNMAEYEALLLGLQLALQLQISVIQVYSDFQLVVNQINSICEVVDPVMVKYVALVAELKCRFQKFCLSKIPRAENEQADSLSKFASDSSLSSRSTDSIISFLRNGIVPEDRQEAMKLRKKASRYTLVDGVLYKRSFSLPLLRCLNPYETEYALREVHEGVCGSHVGARTLAHKVLRQGYYWPNMYKDATHFVQKCPRCQFFAHLTHQPAEELTNLVAPWPFAQWGLDLLGSFVKGVGGVTHLVVGVDYFTKWVEARPLSSLTSKKVEDFVFSSIICRYGIPNQIVADNGTQFNCFSFRDFCSSYGIKVQFTSVYHPESNGMVESVNKSILEGIRPRLE